MYEGENDRPGTLDAIERLNQQDAAEAARSAASTALNAYAPKTVRLALQCRYLAAVSNLMRVKLAAEQRDLVSDDDAGDMLAIIDILMKPRDPKAVTIPLAAGAQTLSEGSAKLQTAVKAALGEGPEGETLNKEDDS